LQFADARDWILERYLVDSGASGVVLKDLAAWLHDMPHEELAHHLVNGTSGPDLSRMQRGLAGAESHQLPSQCKLTYPRRIARWLNTGVVLAQPASGKISGETITISTVLNFAPSFDEANFEFWLASDGADKTGPPIDGRDIAMPGPATVIGAVTNNTSALALRKLASALFRSNIVEEMVCVNLIGSGCDCLDACFAPVSRECVLADGVVLEMARPFTIRAGRGGSIHTVQTSARSFFELVSNSMAPHRLDILDICRISNRTTRNALSALDPIVVSSGKILVFEQHEAGFAELEKHGVEIVAAIPGGALTPGGRGPRSLTTVLSAR
jgi:arginine deiminase